MRRATVLILIALFPVRHPTDTLAAADPDVSPSRLRLCLSRVRRSPLVQELEFLARISHPFLLRKQDKISHIQSRN